MSSGGHRSPRWCTAEAPAPRPAYYEAADAYPALPPRPWCRLYRLMEHRGHLADAPALRMARFLADTDTVSKAGIIRDVPAMIAAYRARCHVSRQTAWTDLGRLVERGLVRQVQAAAPGYPACYRLSYPAAMVDAEMTGLPPDLARELPHRKQQAAGEPGEGHDDDASQDQARDADPEPGGGQEPEQAGEAGSCGRLDTSPLTREGSPPSPVGTGSSGTPVPARGKIGTEERAAAVSVLSACRGQWLAQRGPLRVPDPAELRRVETLTALALRYAEVPGDVRQILTWHVASADDLARVLEWRLGRAVSAWRRASRPDLRDPRRRQAAAEAEEQADQLRAARNAAAVRQIGNGAPCPAEARARVLATSQRATARHHGADPTTEPRPRDRQQRAEARPRLTLVTAPAPAAPGQDEAAAELARVHAEIARLWAGTPAERSRARALAQLWTSRRSPAAR